MKITAYILIIALLLILCAASCGLVGFHYPTVIQDEPLRDPQKIARVEGTNLFLQNGSVIAIDWIKATEISNELRQSSFEVDLEGAKGEPVAIIARQDGWICGTPWAQPIRIPLIRDTVYKNRRELIAMGEYVQPNSQRDAVAHGSQPIVLKTNGTVAATASHP
jgi:hypothetical protein